MEGKRCVQGRWLDAGQVTWLRDWIAAHPDWSRKRLARELCGVWDWRDARGRLKDFAARSLLLKLAQAGAVTLPALREYQRRGPRRWPVASGAVEPEGWTAGLAEVGPVRLTVIEPGTPRAQEWAGYLNGYHYLGLHVVGENLGYLAQDRHERAVAALLFGAPAWRCAVRDRFLGWSGEALRRAQLPRLANNTRFLILPWVRVPHLASHVLGQVVRRLGADWEQKYGHALDWVETFVDLSRYTGTCYRAAGWQYVGQTTGRSRQDRDHQLRVPPKAVYLYSLV